MAIEAIFTPSPPNHELNRLIDASSSSHKKRPAIRMRLLNIFKSKSKRSPPAAHSSSFQRRKQMQQQQELATLGTIELNSYDDLNIDDDDGDDNHGLSSCGSALQLTHISEIGDLDGSSNDKHGSSLSLHSEIVEKVEGGEKKDDTVTTIPKECTVSLHHVEERSTRVPLDEKISKYEEQIIFLFQRGKELYSDGSYTNALQKQKDALKVVHRKGAYAKNCTDSSLQLSNKKFNTHLHQRQIAMIQYEIAKIEFVICKEHNYNNSQNDEESDRNNLSVLFDKMQDAKCKVSLQDLTYYQDQLSQMENHNEKHSSKIKNAASISFDKVYTYQKIEILNTLAKICHKDLHRYEDALRYYKVALDLECGFLTHLLWCAKYNNTSPNDDEDKPSQQEIEIEEWKMKIRQTKHKIGAIHYVNGRFDMALLSSFSHTSYSDSSSQE